VLAQAGHHVTVRGVWFDPVLIDRDRDLINQISWRFDPILQFQPAHPFMNRWVRLQGRIARESYQRFKNVSPALLGYGARMMLKAARQTQADLTIVHSEAGLWVGHQLLKDGFRVGVDFEDWFSEDLLPQSRLTRPIEHLKVLEQQLLRECRYCLVQSYAMAAAMTHAYPGANPTVIYNCFPWAERSGMDHQNRDRRNRSLPSLHWFSQTIGPGRGLEILFQALLFLKSSAEIHLRGHYPDRAQHWLEPLIPDHWRDRVFIHPTVPNAELLSRIAEHDIGLALESTAVLSRDLTITNKFFQYLQAGLAVVATNTAGQREIFSKWPTIGRMTTSNDPEALAHALDELLLNPKDLESAKAAALQTARDHLNWEKQAERLLQAINSTFKDV
jgi:glycosyltransferase involved in cell wall biosynthesis